MGKQIPVQEEVYKKLDILRSTKSKLLSFNTLLDVMAESHLKYSDDNDIRKKLALIISEKAVYEAFKMGLIREPDDQVSSAVRFVLTGHHLEAITILQGMHDPMSDDEK